MTEKPPPTGSTARSGQARAGEPGLPRRLDVPGRTLVVERAGVEDVPAVVALLRDDVLGAGREAAPDDLAPYLRAFAAIDADPHQLLVVVRDEGGIVVGTLQLSLLHGLSRGGALRLQVEAVRVAAGTRGSGLGRALLGWVAEHGRQQGAALAQLTSDLSRTDAHRFYEGLGWVHSHAGMKLDLR